MRDTHTERGPGSKVPPWLFLALPRKCTTVPFPSLPANMSALPKGRESLETQVLSNPRAGATLSAESTAILPPGSCPARWTAVMDGEHSAKPCTRSMAGTRCPPPASRISSRSCRVRPHSQDVNNGASLVRSHTQPGRRQAQLSETDLALRGWRRTPVGAEQGSEMLKKGTNLVTHHWSPQRAWKWCQE